MDVVSGKSFTGFQPIKIRLPVWHTLKMAAFWQVLVESTIQELACGKVPMVFAE